MMTVEDITTKAARGPSIFSRLQDSNWTAIEDRPLNSQSLDDLFANRIPAIRVKGFASSHECRTLSRLIQDHAEFKPYTFTTTADKILKVGPAQCEFTSNRKGDYFSQGQKESRVQDVLRRELFNPVDRVLQILSRVSQQDVAIAQESDHGPYFAGVIRNISKGALLHMDYAPQDAKDWSIEGVTEQISWNLYLQSPRWGGEALVYDRAWQAGDERFRSAESYHYSHDVVGDSIVKINPFIEGDLVFFNSRNYHSVTKSIGQRLTMSSFVGRKNDGRLVLWS